nr:immunoglobulin heavy chain junction region [Homo sapiens]
CVRVGGSVW